MGLRIANRGFEQTQIISPNQMITEVLLLGMVKPIICKAIHGTV